MKGWMKTMALGVHVVPRFDLVASAIIISVSSRQLNRDRIGQPVIDDAFENNFHPKSKKA